jgi:hypothetical protein
VEGRGWVERHRKAVVYACAVALAAGALSVTLYAVRSTSAPRSTMGTTAGAAIPASAIAQLSSVASYLARSCGDARPASIAAVWNHAPPQHTTPAGYVPLSPRPVYLVELVGKFTLCRASVPAAQSPTGRYLVLTIDPVTFQVSYLTLSDHPPTWALARYGPVANLTNHS